MQVVICALAKNEHNYINEWVRWYLNMGFDKIYLYDNDDFGKPYIGDYISKSFLPKVEIINIRGQVKQSLQHDIYTSFYNTHTFDWCFFVDIDEFLVGVPNIKIFLKRFPFAKQIRIKWRLFGDDDLITRDNKQPVMSSFHKVINYSLNRDLKTRGNLEHQGKAIVRGGLPNVVIRSPHFASFKERNNVIPSILPNGMPCMSKVTIRENYSGNIYLNHYMTKTLSEFVKQKMYRTDAVYGDTIKLDYFWRINKKTNDKIRYLKKLGIDV